MTRFNPQDRYFHQAKEQGFRARSVYKFQEIQKKMHLIKSGDRVLDLGSAPGSWLQYVSGIIGNNGLAVGVDIQEIEPLNAKNVQIWQLDVFSDECAVFLKERYQSFNVLISDMAPKTTGIKSNDQFQSVELAFKALSIADILLDKGGNMVIKVFQGADFDSLWRKFKNIFSKAKIITPLAVRNSSKEVYLIGKSFL